MNLQDALAYLFARRRSPRPAAPPPPKVDFPQVEQHLSRTDREIERGASELDYLRVQLKLLRREWPEK
jgi:hypothetical protein